MTVEIHWNTVSWNNTCWHADMLPLCKLYFDILRSTIFHTTNLFASLQPTELTRWACDFVCTQPWPLKGRAMPSPVWLRPRQMSMNACRFLCLEDPGGVFLRSIMQLIMWAHPNWQLWPTITMVQVHWSLAFWLGSLSVFQSCWLQGHAWISPTIEGRQLQTFCSRCPCQSPV